MNTQLLKIINTVLIGKGSQPIDAIRSDTHLRNDLGFDSFDLAELTVRVEEAYGVDIFADGIVNTVGEIEHIIAAKK
jgi:acyl carrier protein